jgi:hypothetical protein
MQFDVGRGSLYAYAMHTDLNVLQIVAVKHRLEQKRYKRGYAVISGSGAPHLPLHSIECKMEISIFKLISR